MDKKKFKEPNITINKVYTRSFDQIKFGEMKYSRKTLVWHKVDLINKRKELWDDQR